MILESMSGRDADGGREDATIPGQISLVEHLDDGHERTTSPSKRVKTTEEPKKVAPANFDANRGLGLHARDGQTPSRPPVPVEVIDLTMSDDDDTDLEAIEDDVFQPLLRDENLPERAQRVQRPKDIIDLPPRHDSVVRFEFAKEEQRLHDWFELDTQRKVNAVTAGQKLGGHSYARILTAILNLRLICAHGRDMLSDEALKLTDGVTYENPMEIKDEEEEEGVSTLNRQRAYGMLELLNQTNGDECQYCRRSVLNMDTEEDDDDGNVPDTIGFMTICYHLVCPKHIKKLRQDSGGVQQPGGFIRCQFCDERVRPFTFELKRKDYTAFLDERERLENDPKLSDRNGGPHPKTLALLDDLMKHKKWSSANPDEPPIKSVVFSSFTTLLDVIEISLNTFGHKFVRLDGKMTLAARDQSIRSLREDPTVRVMLVSIGAGGFGFNLTAANHVYMMEPQWNPAAEAQAVDRVHRLGQTRPVIIKRFIMGKSFEERMLELQRGEEDLAALPLARDNWTAAKGMTADRMLEDLKVLFK